ncbi:putative toxin-antitoxin system toxin component, PIN family [Leadbetterella sp. DM7]|uniref:putative toxin-antitoxin system toxin component, PIN family n=1 Tax=Leadbetterella sp. DM7 TaxID=3235085 RepID=UPI00349E5F46
MKIVLDCNILVVCLTSRSPYHHIYQSLIGGEYELAVTSEILLEYKEIITQKYGQTTAGAFMALLSELPNIEFINTYYQWNLISADPDDNKYSDCAIAFNADYLVTEDKHFNILTTVPFPEVPTLSLDEFMKIL